jgi:hypothetical protein
VNELIFFAVIIFFSIIESIARSRRQKKGGGESPLPELPDPAEWERRFPAPGRGDDDLPTYDEEPSYDDRAQGDRGVRPQPSAPSRPSSEVLLPGDLLQELERLAGRAKEGRARTLDLPKESPPLPETPPAPPPVPTRTRARVPSRPVRRAPVTRAPSRTPAEHAVHLSHAGYGTDPSSRAPSLQDNLDPLAERRGADAQSVLSQLRSTDRHQLRRAVILQEVLGPPLALREE